MRGKHRNGDAARRGDLLASNLRDRGLIVLRNQALFVRRPEARVPLAIVGLDDLWTGRLNAAKAFAGVDPKLPIICLNHNPVNVRQLLEFPWQWMLSGQVASSRLGQRFYPHRYRHYVSGHYSVEGRNLYVNRGVSYGLRRRQTCRPEITVFRLTGNGAA
jgi:predicted MPP superfamily phosphohydrolase